MASKKAPAFAFPFIGAGVPSPFESVEYEIIFERPPSSATCDALCAGFPPALGATLRGSRLSLSGGRPELHGDVAAAAGERVDADGFASPRAFTQLARGVEARLLEIHAHDPIVLALFVLDAESDPPKLSKWHTASAKQIAALLSRFDHVLADSAHDDAVLATQLITYAEMSRIKLPAKWTLWAEPARRVVYQLLAANVDEARRVLLAFRGHRILVFHLQMLVDALTRDQDGSWARTQLRKWPQDVPWDTSIAAAGDWARHRPRLREGVIALGADIAEAAAPLSMADSSCRDRLLPGLALLAVDEERDDALLSSAFRAALAVTNAYERKRFLESVAAMARQASGKRAERFAAIAAALGTS